jgi:tight adherence protein C
MSAAVVFGALTGLGVVGVLASVRPRRAKLSASLQVLVAEPAGGNGAVSLGSSRRHGGLVGMLLGLAPVDRDWIGAVSIRRPAMFVQVRKDLAAAGSSTLELSEQITLCCFAGALAPFLFWALLSSAGLGVPLLLPAWAGIAGAVCFGLLPFFRLRRSARVARRSARRSVGCFLDLVVLALAGGLGIEGAIHSAAAICETTISQKIVHAIAQARDAGSTTWDALAGLGRDLAVPELEELSAAISLAGTEGARVRSTLAAKAASIRSHELADAEVEANTITERLFLPGVLLLIGFLVFIGYPALTRLMTGL